MYRIYQTLILAIFFLIGCEKKDVASVTGSDGQPVYGREADPSQYFYDFYTEQDVRSKYLFFKTPTMTADPGRVDPLEDTLNLSSFSQYVLAVPGEDFSSYTTREPFSEINENFDINNDGQFLSSSIENLVFSDAQPWYQPYTLIDSLLWSTEDERYTIGYSGSDRVYDTLNYTQPQAYDSLIFKTVIDTNLISFKTFTFLDKDEYNVSIEMQTEDVDTTVIDTLYYKKRFVNKLSMLRLKNQDCNLDGLITSAEVRPGGVCSGEDAACSELLDYSDCVASDLCLWTSNECLDENAIFIPDALGGFCDRTNGVYEDGEVFLDLGTAPNSIFDSNEPFQDMNCNNEYDQGEVRNNTGECPYFCASNLVVETEEACLVVGSDENAWVKGIFRTDSNGGFCDIGNRVYDEAEWPDDSDDMLFLIVNGDNQVAGVDSVKGNRGDLSNYPFYKRTTSINNLIVDYQSLDNPEANALQSIKTSLDTTWNEIDSSIVSIDLSENKIIIEAPSTDGVSYYEVGGLIVEYDVPAYFSKPYSKITGYETTYSNVMIEQLDEELESYCRGDSLGLYLDQESCESGSLSWISEGGDYFILKSKWQTNEGQEYDYIPYRRKTNGDIMQLVHPSYFMHFGYEDNFWERDSIHEEILVRTQMGLLKEGDSFSVDSIIVTPTADFLEKTSYLVETDTIAVPYTLGYLNGNDIVCYQDDSIVESFSECPRDSVSVLITDCFKITRTRTLKMFGNGVEYGSRNTIWLANLPSFKGIVMSSSEYRWSEPIWATDNIWTEYNRIELMDFSLIDNNGSGLGRLIDYNKELNFDSFGKLEEFNNEPYKFKPLNGIHRMYFPDDID